VKLEPFLKFFDVRCVECGYRIAEEEREIER
jgi:Zn ribbon nucleic-acid-binding protein